MRSRSPWTWLLIKEWRGLTAAPSWWVMLALCGPLAGFSFIDGVRAFAEASGQGARAGGLDDALFPFDGVIAPTFSAYEIVASFLLPFVAIRIFSADRTSGALKLELQQGLAPVTLVAAKALVLMLGWLIAAIPLIVAGVLWASYGGSFYAPEVAALALGHLLNAGLVIALAAVAAMVVEHPSTAAILVLSVTVGSWVLEVVATMQGGVWEALARYTPAQSLQAFRHGLLRLDLVAIGVIATLTALGLAALWTLLGTSLRWRLRAATVLVATGIVVGFGAAHFPQSWDVSENRRNSFSAEDTAMLARVTDPLSIDVHLAPTDPRRVDLEQQTLSKLRRVMPRLQVTYRAATASGLFEQADAQYGQIAYDLGGKRTTGRAMTTDAVLGAIYELAGVQAPDEGEAGVPGHPLKASPRYAALLFYGLWPFGILVLALTMHRRKYT